MITSCSSKKFLQDGEHLLKRNDVEIVSNKLTSAEKERLSDKSHDLIYLKPNTNYLFFIPKERAALKYRNRLDTPRFTSLIMKLDGESPSLIDTARIEGIVTNLNNNVRAEGYFDSKTSYEIKYRKKTAKITYSVEPGKAYRITKYNWTVSDSTIANIMMAHKSKSAIKEGMLLSRENVAAEYQRIVGLLKNEGYYYFSSTNFKQPLVDTTDNKLLVGFIIDDAGSPATLLRHKINQINLYPGYDSDDIVTIYKDSVINGVTFHFPGNEKIVKPKYLLEKLEIDSGGLYNFEEGRKSIRGLSSMSAFRYPRFTIEKDPSDSTGLIYKYFLAENKKVSEQFSPNIFYASIKNTNKSLGFSLDGNRTIQNVFGGSERFEFSLNASVETAFQGLNIGNLLTAGTRFNLFVPRFRDNTKSMWFMNRVLSPVVSDPFLKDLRRLGESKYELGINYEDNQSISQTTQIDLSYGVKYRKNKSSYDFSFFDIGYFAPVKGDSFLVYYGNNPFFINSFREQLLTGVFFRSFEYQTNLSLGRDWQANLIVDFESSGHEAAAVNLISRALGNGDVFTGNENKFGLSQFVKAEIDFRPSLKLNDKMQLAFRINTGIAIPFGNYRTIPATSLFSLGGANSLRGWTLREVGPGSFVSQRVQEGDIRAFSVGDFMLQSSIEFRSDLFWILEGALFMDAGNVWALQSDRANQIGQLTNFYEQLAIDGGIGLRFDFTFFLIRFDFGYPLKNWYVNETSKDFWTVRSLKDLTYSNVNFQFGVNYPF